MSPAEKGGLRAGDVVLRVNDHTPRTAIELNRELITAADPRDVQFQVQHKNERRTVSIQLVPEREVFNAALIRQKLGVTVQELTARQAEEMGLDSPGGLVIGAVEKNSPAARANLGRGIVIRKIDGQVPESIVAAAKILHGRKAGESVELSLVVLRVRGGFVESLPAKVQVVLR
jgi:S1-C subfamily serine protease